MTSPWNRNSPEVPRRGGSWPSSRSWRPAQVPKSPTKAERAEFVTQLLARLPAAGEEPVSTTLLGDHFQFDQYLRNNLLYNSLARLANLGLVDRVVMEDEHVRYWRRTPVGDQHVRDTTDQR